MNKKLKFNQPKKLPLPDDFVSIRFSPTTDESYIGKNSGISAGTTPSHKLDISGQSLIKKDGYIRIGMDRKVYFEYYGLEKPDENDYINYPGFLRLAWGEYEASKQLIEVSNEHAVGNIYPDQVYIYINEKLRKAKNNQKCKAEVIENKATIVELTKE